MLIGIIRSLYRGMVAMSNDILVKIGADVTQFSRAMSDSNRALKNFGQANAETFGAFKKVGAAFVGVSAAIATGLGYSVKTAANFESAMSQVKAISGATGDEFDSLRDKAIEMGNSTMFSASESADAMANLAQMGWNTDQILGGIEHTLNLAAAGGLELADSAMIMANTMNQFGIEASEAERVADVMALTASSAGTDVQELGDALQYAGANASASGLSLEETAAFIGVLGDAGITGSKAGTALNAMLRDLKKNSEDGAIAVGDQSVALYDAEGNMRDMPAVIGEVVKATEGMSNEHRDAALATIMGDQALVGFNAIASKGADSVADLSKELLDSKGAAGDMAEIMQDNLNGALTELSSAFEGVQIAIDSALIPIIQKAAEWLTKLADWFNSLSDTMKSNIAIFSAITAVLTGVMGAFLLFIGFIPQLIAGFSAVVTVIKFIAGVLATMAGAVSLPFVLIVAAVAAAVAAIYFFWEPIKDFFIMLWEGIKVAGIAVWEWLKEVWASTVDFFVELWTGTVEFFTGLWDGVKEFFVELWDGIVETATTVWDVIKEAWLMAAEYLYEVFEPIIDFFIDTWESVNENATQAWDSFTEMITTVWEGIKTIASNIWELIKIAIITPILVLIQMLTGDFEGAKSTLSQIWENIKEIAQSTWDALKSIVSAIVKGLITSISNSWNNAKSFLTGLWTAIKSTASNLWEGMKSALSSIVESTKAAISAKWNEIKTAVVTKATEIVTAAKEKFEAVKEGIRDKLTEAVTVVGEKIGEMPGKVKEFVGDMLDSGKALITGLINGIKNMAGKAVEAITGVVDGVVNKAKSLLNIKSPSRVFMEIGEFTGMGLVRGMDATKSAVERASERMTNAAIIDDPNIDMSYATPSGMRGTLSSAVNGTMDVSNAETNAILRRVEQKLDRHERMIVELDGEQVGRAVTPHVNHNNAIDAVTSRYFD